jgi:hypothetical protein
VLKGRVFESFGFPLAFSPPPLWRRVVLRAWLYRLRLLPAYRPPCRVISIRICCCRDGETIGPAADRLQKGLKTAVLSCGYGAGNEAGAVISDDQVVIGSLSDWRRTFWLARHLRVPILSGKIASVPVG